MFKTNVQYINLLYNTHGAFPTFFFLKPITQCQTVTSNSANVLWVYVSSKAALRGFFFPRKKCIKRHLHVLPWLVLIYLQLIFKESGVKVWACWGLTFTPCYQALKTAIKEMLLPLIYMKLTPWMSGSLKKTTKKDIIDLRYRSLVFTGIVWNPAPG